MRLMQRGRRKLAAEVCPTKFDDAPSATHFGEESDEDFLEMAHDVLKETLSAVFVLKSANKETELNISAPKFNNHTVELKFTVTDNGDTIYASHLNELGGTLDYQTFGTDSYAKYSALFDNVLIWVCDRLFDPDAQVYNCGVIEEATGGTEKEAKIASQIKDLLVSGIPQGKAITMAESMSRDPEALPKKTATCHYYMARGLKKVSARIMQHLVAKQDKFLYPDVKRVFDTARMVIIKSIAHILRSRDLINDRKAKRLVGGATLDIVGRFNELEESILDIIEA